MQARRWLDRHGDFANQSRLASRARRCDGWLHPSSCRPAARRTGPATSQRTWTVPRPAFAAPPAGDRRHRSRWRGARSPSPGVNALNDVTSTGAVGQAPAVDGNTPKSLRPIVSAARRVVSATARCQAVLPQETEKQH
jgi:hypothetical protein